MLELDLAALERLETGLGPRTRYSEFWMLNVPEAERVPRDAPQRAETAFAG